MAKFEYRMQNILDIKYKLETQAKSIYSNASSRLESEQKKLDSLNNDIKLYEQQIIELYENKLNIKEIRRCIDAIEIKKIYVQRQIQEVNKARKNLEIARMKLNQVMVERKMHEKLKDKEFEEYVKIINNKETKEIDELVSYSYNKVNSR